jgi:isopentenyldiphosphate isomerase
MKEYPRALIDSVIEANFVPFIGAGISMESGAPSWSCLLEQLIESLEDGPLAQEIRNRYRSGEISSVDVPELHALLKGTSFGLLDFLVSRFTQPFQTNIYHDLVRQFPFGTIVTTNYDCLIERSIEEINRPQNTIWKDSQLRFYNEARAVQILKIHGTITDPESCVLSKSDYDSYAQQRPLLYGFLETLFSIKAVLFLGFSLKDPNVGSLLDKLRLINKNSPRDHFAVLHKPAPDEINQLKKYGIQVIVLSGASVRDSLEEWLKGLVRLTRQIFTGHVNKAQAYSADIEREIAICVPGSIIRMRAALGLISMPKNLEPGMILYDSKQDDAELRLGQELRKFLAASDRNRYHTIVYINPLLQRQKGFSPRSIIVRLRAMLEFLTDFGPQIRIAPSTVPISMNHLIVNNRASFLSHKRLTTHGPTALRRTMNRWVIQSEIDVFDVDFDAVMTNNKEMAISFGVDPESPSWEQQFSKIVIQRAIDILERERKVLECDGSGQVVGLRNRDEAHTAGVRHRSVHLHIIRKDSDGSLSILLQQRASTTDLYGDKFDVAVAGHPQGTDFLAEVLREAAEELGIWIDRDHILHAYSYPKEIGNDKEFVDVFAARADGITGSLNAFESTDVEGLYWAKLGAISSQTPLLSVDGFKRFGPIIVPSQFQISKDDFIPQTISEIEKVGRWSMTNLRWET